jgi:hypothetical protein
MRVVPQRMTADLDGEIVVFLIGMRIWKSFEALETYAASGTKPIACVPATSRSSTTTCRLSVPR